MSDYRGRFAPSPTGPLHFGSLVAALASWLDARAAGGRWLVRIEDVDTTRTVSGAAEGILRTLDAFGMVSDEPIIVQSARTSAYDGVLRRLRDSGSTYRCVCSRKEIADAGASGPEGTVYPGTCRSKGLPWSMVGAERVYAPPGSVTFDDRVQGHIEQDVSAEIGDFVLKRRDFLHAYQLAVVIDDADAGITNVVRGADLLLSTPRQIHLQRLLGLPTPHYLHIPVATGADGQKLSKQNLAPAISGDDAAHALRAALAFLGQPPAGASRPAAILEAATRCWDPGTIPRKTRVQVTDSHGLGRAPDL